MKWLFSKIFHFYLEILTRIKLHKIVLGTNIINKAKLWKEKVCYTISLVDTTAKRTWNNNKAVNDILHLSSTSESTLITMMCRHFIADVKINTFETSTIIFKKSNLQN